ncbi:hypothetical protein BVRB_1g008380 [Beta vulgaris subsp. vulgaris]|nr:hypothetical protein BVRB_1g008380 [Beta vulgaris subsp. vulgaris]
MLLLLSLAGTALASSNLRFEIIWLRRKKSVVKLRRKKLIDLK